MGALDRVIRFLDSQPWSVRSRFVVRRSGSDVFVQRAGMQAAARDVGDGQVEILYECARHDTARERVAPEVGGRLLVAIMQRDRLCPVDVPDAEPPTPADRPGD